MRRMSLAVACLVGVIALGGVGVHALFTSTASASHSAATATLTLNLGATGASTNRMTVSATNLVPTDSYYRSFDLINSGTKAFSAITLTTTASPSSLLDTDATNGLQMVIQKCSVAWTETGGPPYTYTCGGTTTSVLASTAVIATNIALSNITLTANTDNYLRVTLTLPSTAGNTFQGLSSTITFGFTATQRAAAAQ